MTRSVCVITGTRAEYGLLAPVMAALREDPAFKLQIAVTGMHLSTEFGLTYRDIEADGHQIDERVEMLLSSDTDTAIATSVGLGVIGFAKAFDRLRPDLVLLLGDRFEILAAAQAALIAKLPVAHIFGGDTTAGAYDEAIRHAITKMAHLHFVTNADAAKRVRQLGENPAHVHLVGNPALDTLRSFNLMDRAELEASLEFELRSRNLIITFHPETLARQSPSDQFAELLAALDTLGEDVGLIFSKPNADSHGRALFAMIDDFVGMRDHAAAYTSLGHRRYLSVLAQADAMVGNSSSGLLEMPSFAKPTVNIGDRQKGRMRAASVIDCASERDAIATAIHDAFALDCTDVVNPYGDGHAAPKILAALKAVPDYRDLIQKPFFDLETPC